MIKTVVEQIRIELRRRVLVGTWGLGQRLYEEEIAHDLDVSRSAVREAVRLVEQEGLLVRAPHRGLFVASPSARDITEVAQLRAVLESSAVFWGNPPDDATIAEMERICARFDEIGDRDHMEAVNLDRAFHGLIAQSTTNRLLLRKHQELDGHIAIFFHWVTAHVPGRLDDIGLRHHALLDAYARGDSTLFRDAVLLHYEGAAVELARHLPEADQAARREAQAI